MPTSRLQTTLIDDWSDLGTLESEWNALLRRSRSDSIFLTWEWIKAWLDATDGRDEPLVLVTRDGNGRLLGIAPFYVALYRFVGVVPFRMLRICADEGTGSEYPDWIIDREREHEVEQQLVAALCARTSHWDGAWLPNVSPSSGASNHLMRVFRAQRCRAQVRSVPFCATALPGSLNEYEASLSTGQRQQIRRKCRKLLQRDDVSITRCEAQDDIRPYLESLFDLHHRRWQLRGDVGSFRRRPEMQRFYRRFAPVALSNGWLRLYALRQGGEFRAVQLGYTYNNVFHQIQEGFDPEFVADAGNVLRHKVIEACITDGVDVYDFMAGESEHKLRWGAKSRDGADLFIGRAGAKTWPLFAAEVWPTGRYLRPRPTGPTEPAVPVPEDGRVQIHEGT